MKNILYICEISASFAECLISLYFLVRYLGYNNSKNSFYTFIGFVLLFIDSAFISQIKNYELLTSLLFVIIIILFTFIALKGKLIEKLFISILLNIMILLINLLIVNLIAGMMQLYDIKLLHSDTVFYGFRITVLFASKFIYFLAVKAILMSRRKVTYSLTLIEWLSVIMFFIFSCFICISLWYINRSNDYINVSLYIAIIISLIVINIMLYWLLQKLGKESYRKTEMALMELKLNSRKELISEIKIQYDEMKTLKHDMKHYIHYPLYLLENNKILEAKKYLDELYCEKIEPISSVVFSGNELVDAVINLKIVLCKKHNIDIKCETINDCLKEMELDISIMLSNLFDNAIESSCSMDKDRMIILSIKHKKSYLNINMKNRINNSVLFYNPELTTKKQDKKQYGYGLRSIKKISERYEGTFKIYEDEGYFIVDILLKIR